MSAATPSTVDEYVAARPPAVQERLAAVGRIVAEEVAGATETIRYHMPTFGDAGRTETCGRPGPSRDPDLPLGLR